MNHNEFFFRNSEPHWMSQSSSGYGYGGRSPRTDLWVSMCCPKCEEKAQEEIREVDGVQDVFTDQARSMVTVYGYADTRLLLKKAKKVDKKAELLTTESFSSKYSRHGRLKSHSHGSSHHGHYGSHYNYGQSYDRRGSYFPPESSSTRDYRADHYRLGGYDHGNMGSNYYERPEYRYASNEYRPSQSYPPRYEGDYRDSPYSGSYTMNPNYIKHIEYY